MRRSRSNVESTGTAKTGPSLLQMLQHLESSTNMERYNQILNDLLKTIPAAKSVDFSTFGSPEAAKTFIQLCNKTACKLLRKGKNEEAFSLLECAKKSLGSMPSKEMDEELEALKAALCNSLAIYCHQINDKKLAMKFLRNAINHEKQYSTAGRAIYYINAASIYLKEAQFEKASKYSQAAVASMEESVYAEVNSGKRKALLQQNTAFMRNLQILLVGYLVAGKCNEKLKASGRGQSLMTYYREQKELYTKGEKLSKKFIGEHHLLTGRFKVSLLSLEKQKIGNGRGVAPENSEKYARLSSLIDFQNMNTPRGTDSEIERAIEDKPYSTSPLKRKPFKIRSMATPVSRQPLVKSFNRTATNQSDVGEGEAAEADYKEMVGTILRKKRSVTDKIRIRNSSANNVGRKPKEVDFSEAVEAIMKTRIDIEERIKKKVEEGLLASQKIDETVDKRRELEEQIKKLKAENERNNRMKFEKELEIEKFRLTLQKASEISSLGVSTTFPAPLHYYPTPTGYYPYYPLHTHPHLSYPVLDPMMSQQQFPPHHAVSMPAMNLTTGADFSGYGVPGFQRTASANSHNEVLSPGLTSLHRLKDANESLNSNNSKPRNEKNGETTSNNASNSEATPTNNQKDPATHTSIQSATSLTTPHLLNVSTNKKGLQLFYPEGETDGQPAVIKMETFGPGGLGALLADFKKEKPKDTLNSNRLQPPADNNIFPNYDFPSLVSGSNNLNASPPKLFGEPETQPNEPKADPPSTDQNPGKFQLMSAKITEEMESPDASGFRMYAEARERDLSPHEDFQTEMKRIGEFGRKESATPTNISEINKVSHKQNKNQNNSISKVDIYGEDSGDEKASIKKLNSLLNFSPNDEVLEPPSPRPWDLLTNHEVLSFPAVTTIRKTCFEFSETDVYRLECVVFKNLTEISIRINLKKQTETGKYLLVDEELIKMKDLCKVLEYIEHQDVLPLTMGLKSIKNSANFMKYCFMPFVWVCPDTAEGGKLIQLRAKPKGFLPEETLLTFLGAEYSVGLYHIAQNDFRVILTHIDNEESIRSFRFELNLDDQTFSKFFEHYSETPADNHSEFILNTLDILEDEEANHKELDEIASIVKKYESIESVEEEVTACKFKSKNEEKTFIDNVFESLRDLEVFFSLNGVNSVDTLTESHPIKFVKMRFMQECKKKNFTFMHECLETQKYKIHLKNLFETYGLDETKIKAEGRSEYSYTDFCQDFGVEYTTLDLEDRLAFCSLVSDCYKLETHEKPIDEEDQDAYEANPIVRIPVDYGCFHRIFKGELYKFPASFTLIGVRGNPAGVRVTVFNAEQCSETGVFLFIDPAAWKKVPKPLKPGEKKKRTRKYVGLPMVEEYNLTQILKSYGFKLLDDYVIFDNDPARVSVRGVRSLKGFSCVDRLENAVTIQKVIKYLKEKTDLFEGLL